MFLQCSCRFSNVHFIAVNSVTYLPVYNITFMLHGVLVLGAHQYFLDGTFASEVCVDVILTAYPFDAFEKAFYIWYAYVSLVSVVAVVILIDLGLFVDRRSKESIYIMINYLALNKSIGKYNLPLHGMKF